VGYPHTGAQVVYVIPETSIEDEQKKEAHKNNTPYDPLSDKDINLDKITKLITEQNLKVKAFFKKYAESEEHEKAQSLNDLNE